MSTYEAEFYWREPAKDVVVTGSFDDWACKIHLEKTAAGFAGKARVPYGKKVDFKYIVDGQWRLNYDFPTTQDWRGNINNYIMTEEAPPAAPEPPAVQVPILSVEAPSDKPSATSAQGEPVTPVNQPASAPVAAVTPMHVPGSSIIPVCDFDPDVSREFVKTIIEVDADKAKDEPAQPIDLAESPVEPKPNVIIEAVHDIDEIAAKAEGLQKAEEKPAAAVPLVDPLDQSQPKSEPLPEPTPEPVPVPQPAPVEDQTPVVIAPPVAAEGASPTSATTATKVDHDSEVKVPVDAKPSPAPAVNGVAPATPQKTETPSKTTPSRPSLDHKGSTRSPSGRLGFPRKRGGSQESNDLPSTPGSLKREDSSSRKKRNSFLTKIHDIFHPHHKNEH